MTHPTDGTCIFCKIVAGQIPCFKLLEDDNTIAFMDINPVNPGHALAVAKGHWPTVDVIPPEVLADVARTRAARRQGGVQGTEAGRREPAAGQWRGRRAKRAAPALPHHAARGRRRRDRSTGSHKPGDMAAIKACMNG